MTTSARITTFTANHTFSIAQSPFRPLALPRASVA